MKATPLLLRGILWLPIAIMAQTGDSVRLSAKVTRLVGQARYYTNTWNALHLGSKLHGGSTIQTAGGRSVVDIQLQDSGASGQVTVCILSNSVLSLVNLNLREPGASRVREIELRLARGQLRLTFEPAFEGEFRLIAGNIPVSLSPHGSGDHRHRTVFEFRVPGVLTVYEGSLDVWTTGTEKRMVTAGEQFFCEDHQVSKVPPNGSVDIKR